MEKLQTKHEEWAILTKYLPAGWKEKAGELGALTRRRKIDNPETLLRVLLIHIAEGISFRTTSVYAKEANLCEINDTSLLHRLRVSKEWFHWIVLGLLEKCKAIPAPDKFSGKYNVRLVDSTLVDEPGVTGSLWRLHYSFNLNRFNCDSLELTSQKEGENLIRYSVSKNDLIIADRNFRKRKGIVHVVENQGYIIVRYHSNSLPLYKRNGHRLDLPQLLCSLSAPEVGDWDVWIRHPENGSLIKGRILALRKSQEAMELAQKKIQREAHKKGRKTKDNTLEYAQYIIIFTTLNRRRFSGKELLEQYRNRWQIELIFKRLKSIVGIGHLPKCSPDSSIAWLYGKLILALLTELLYREAEFFSPWGYPISDGK